MQTQCQQYGKVGKPQPQQNSCMGGRAAKVHTSGKRLA